MVLVGPRDWGGREGLLCYSTAGTVHRRRAARARERRLGLGGAGNAGRGASPTAGKREGIFL